MREPMLCPFGSWPAKAKSFEENNFERKEIQLHRVTEKKASMLPMIPFSSNYFEQLYNILEL